MQFQGLRNARNRSILGVCEDFEYERNDEIALLGNFLLFVGNDVIGIVLGVDMTTFGYA